MGQRSLFVLGYDLCDSYGGTPEPQENRTVNRHRIARYLHWNWGPFMLIRAAQAVRFLQTFESNGGSYMLHASSHALGVAATFCVDQTTGDTQGLHPGDVEDETPIDECDNNNGAFLVHIDPDGKWSFGFLVGPEDGGDLKTVVGAAIYATYSGLSPESLLDGVHTESDRRIVDAVTSAMSVLLTAEDNGHMMSQATADMLAQPVEN